MTVRVEDVVRSLTSPKTYENIIGKFMRQLYKLQSNKQQSEVRDCKCFLLYVVVFIKYTVYYIGVTNNRIALLMSLCVLHAGNIHAEDAVKSLETSVSLGLISWMNTWEVGLYSTGSQTGWVKQAKS